jgi:hypothetical protein
MLYSYDAIWSSKQFLLLDGEYEMTYLRNKIVLGSVG